MKKDILTPTHKYWKALKYRLNQMVYTMVEGRPQFNCRHDLSNTKRILKSLPNEIVAKYRCRRDFAIVSRAWWLLRL